MLATDRRIAKPDRTFSPKPSTVLDSDDLPRKLSVIARVFTISRIKNVFRPPHRRLLESCQPERSAKRRRVLDTPDMPREGKSSPRRRQPSDTQSTSGSTPNSSSNVAVVARERSSKASQRDGEEDGRLVSKPLQSSRAPSSVPGSAKPSSNTPARDSPPTGEVGFVPNRNHIHIQSHIQARICQRRAELIGKLMAIITSCLDKQLAALEAACDGEEGGSGACNSTRGSAPRSRSDRRSRPAAGQKRQNQNQSRDSDEEDSGDRRSPKTNKRAKTVTENHQKFACPYYKRFPEKFKNQRTCSGPGWDECHRMKEHLDRRHRLPKYRCKRCCEYFEEEGQLEDHQRMDIPCRVGDRDETDPSNGFDDKQAELMSRKKSRKSEVERWKEIYTILFGVEAHSPEMPTPFYDATDGARTDDIQYKAIKPFIPYCRREAPKVIQQALENELDRDFIAVEQRISMKLNTLVQDVLQKLLSTYQAIGSPEEAVSLPDPNTRGTEADNITGSSAVLPPELSELDFDDFHFEIAPGFDESFMGTNLSGPHFGSHCDQSLAGDSAYYTRSTDDDSTYYLPTTTTDSRYLGMNH